MKNTIQCFWRTIAVFVVLTILFSLLSACLYYTTCISSKTFHIMNWGCGMLAFGAGGGMLGYQITKKALINAFIVCFIVMIPMLLVGSHSLFGVVEVFCKLASFLALCMLIYTKKVRATPSST